MGMDKAVAAKIDIKALVITVKALIEGTIKNKQFIKKELLKNR